jgi:hypothetical protein
MAESWSRFSTGMDRLLTPLKQRSAKGDNL